MAHGTGLARIWSILISSASILFITLVIVVITQTHLERARVARNVAQINRLTNLESSLRELTTQVRDAAHADAVHRLPEWPTAAARFIAATAALRETTYRLESEGSLQRQILNAVDQVKARFEAVRTSGNEEHGLRASSGSFADLSHDCEDLIEAETASIRADHRDISQRLATHLNLLFATAVMACLIVLLSAWLLHSIQRAHRRLQKSEASRREMEERLNATADNVPGVVFTIVERPDGSQEVLYANPRLELLVGPRTAAHVGMDIDRFLELIHAEDRAEFDKVGAEAVHAPRQHGLEYRVLTDDGNYRWIQTIATPVPGSQPGEVVWHGILLDIDSRHRADESLRCAEKQLRESLDRQHALLEAIPDLLFVLDADGACVDVPAAESERPLVRPAESVGRKIREVIPESVASACMATAEVARRTGEVQQFDYEVEAPAGTREFEARIAPCGDDNVLVIARDVTAMRRARRDLESSRQRYQALFDESPVNLKEMDMTDLLDELDRLRARGITDLRHYLDEHPEEVFALASLARTTNVNKTTLQCFQAESNSELIGRYAETRLDDHRGAIRDQIVELAENRVLSDFEVPIRTLGGEHRTLWVHVSSLDPRRPRPEHILFTSVDVTRRKWAESILELQRTTLERIATGAALQEILDEICAMVERIVPNGICSILTLDPARLVLNVAAGPSLPGELRNALNGLVPGERAGSCGTAIWLGEPVFVSDTSSDPRWFEFLTVAKTFDIGACWAYPVWNEEGNAIASFAISNRASMKPEQRHIDLLRTASHLIGIALRRDESQRRLRDSRERLQALAEHIPGVVYSYDVVAGFGRQLIYLGPGFEELVGPKNAAAIRGRFDALFELIHPDDRERVAREAAVGSQNETTVDLEARLRTDDDSYVWIRSISRPIKGDHGRVHWHVVVVDIEKQKRGELALRESERRFKTLYDENPSMYFTVSTDGVIQSVNKYGAQELGYSAGELVGKHVDMVFHSSDRAQVQEFLKACIAEPSRTRFWELRKVKKNGTAIWVREAARPIRDADGRTMILIVCEDISDRKQVEQEILHKAELERLLFRELDHRVRNNLSSLLALIDLTRRGSTTMTEFAATIRSRVDVMAAVHSLLSRSHWTPLSMRSMLEAIIPSRLRARLSMIGEDTLIPPRQVTALGMVIHELLTNSVKYGAMSVESGGVELSWSREPCKDSAVRLTMTWTETGGPAVLDEPSAGAGTELIEGLVQTELRGSVDFNYPITGAWHRIEILVDRQRPAAGETEPLVASFAGNL